MAVMNNVEENLLNQVMEAKISTTSGAKEKSDSNDTKGKLPKEIGTDYQFKRKIVWFNSLGFLFLHLMALYGLILGFVSAKFLTVVWTFAAMFATGQGVTMGAHRLFSHKTFKATFLVKLVLILLQTAAGQNCLYIWVRDHRLHHKYSDTDADPHNAKRGFFFSHMGWLMSRKHPAVISKGKTIDMSDLEADPLVMFQKDHYKPLYLLFAIAIPVAVPVYLWNETYINSFFLSYMLRYILTLHITWLVNSAAHLYGTRPYDKTLQPVESSFVSFVSVGEGWHNFHHVFPWDYRASELGMKYNITTMLIDFLAKTGLIYDLKAAPVHMVKHRVLKAGDGTHLQWGDIDHHEEVPHPDDVAKTLKENGYIVPTKSCPELELKEEEEINANHIMPSDEIIPKDIYEKLIANTEYCIKNTMIKSSPLDNNTVKKRVLAN